MKLIFLDFDGVLNTPKTWGNFVKGDGSTAIDRERVELVNQIVSATGAHVVLSTSWRIGHDRKYLQDLLIKRGAKFPIMDMTPGNGRVARREEIVEFLHTIPSYLGGEPFNFVILDDDGDASIAGHFVQTNQDNCEGLTPELTQDAIRILNG